MPLLVPILGLIADALQLLYLLLLERIPVEIVIICCVQLGQGADAVVFQNIAERGEVVDHADLLYLVDGLRIVETHQIRPNRVMLAIADLNPLLRNVHPGSALAAEVNHVETFEAVVLELRVLGSQAHSLDLQRQRVELDVPRAEDLPFGVGGDEDVAILVQALNAAQHVLEGQFSYLGDVELSRRTFKVVLSDRVHLVFCMLDGPFGGGLLLNGNGFLRWGLGKGRTFVALFGYVLHVLLSYVIPCEGLFHF
jgi:hypothetical protein